VFIGMGRIWLINATIDTPPYVLGKPTEDIVVYVTQSTFQINFYVVYK